MTCARFIATNAALTVLALSPGSVIAGEDWFVPGDFATIQEAIDSGSVLSGDTIRVGPGEHDGALVDIGVEIKGEGGAVINGGPLHGSGMSQGFRMLLGSEGATISHLAFTTDLSIMNGDGVANVTVTHCTFENAVQAVSNWRGSGWEITHNEIIGLRTRCGGGIGILVGDYTGGVVTDNLIAHNKITGIVDVADGDCGGYSATGIVLYADFRWNRDGATNIAFNRILKNSVALESDMPALVDVYAIELTDTLDDPTEPAILEDNTIGFNDWRDTVNLTSEPVLLTPSNLDEANAISRNLGDNRGHGLHPSTLFRPE